jgi:ribosomal protein L37E
MSFWEKYPELLQPTKRDTEKKRREGERTYLTKKESCAECEGSAFYL